MWKGFSSRQIKSATVALLTAPHCGHQFLVRFCWLRRSQLSQICKLLECPVNLNTRQRVSWGHALQERRYQLTHPIVLIQACHDVAASSLTDKPRHYGQG